MLLLALPGASTALFGSAYLGLFGSLLLCLATCACGWQAHSLGLRWSSAWAWGAGWQAGIAGCLAMLTGLPPSALFLAKLRLLVELGSSGWLSLAGLLWIVLVSWLVYYTALRGLGQAGSQLPTCAARRRGSSLGLTAACVCTQLVSLAGICWLPDVVLLLACCDA